MTLTTLDARRKLGVGRTRIYRMLWDGELPATKIGRMWFIAAEDVEALARRRRNAAKTSRQ